MSAYESDICQVQIVQNSLSFHYIYQINDKCTETSLCVPYTLIALFLCSAYHLKIVVYKVIFLIRRRENKMNAPWQAKYQIGNVVRKLIFSPFDGRNISGMFLLNFLLGV